jgi:SAM-dependent methyltransferase
MRTSTSWHRTSVDGRRSPIALSTYVIGNLASIIYPPSPRHNHVPLASWPKHEINPELFANALHESPTRALSNLFWAGLPWNSLPLSLGPLNIVDLGCGSGRYFDYLQQCSGGIIKTYTGIDGTVHPDWSQKEKNDSRLRFIKSDLNHTAHPLTPTANLVISQSSLEHINDDLLLFNRLSQQLKAKPRPLLQIHLIPSLSCLPLYGFHGVRQYSPRTLAPAWKLFKSFSKAKLFCLGNPAITWFHWHAITLPSWINHADWRRTRPSQYEKKLRHLLLNSNNSLKAPSFYALIIYSYSKLGSRPLEINL